MAVLTCRRNDVAMACLLECAVVCTPNVTRRSWPDVLREQHQDARAMLALTWTSTTARRAQAVDCPSQTPHSSNSPLWQQ